MPQTRWPLRTLVSSAQGQGDHLEDVMDPCTCKAPNKANCDLNIHNLVHLNGFMSCTYCHVLTSLLFQKNSHYYKRKSSSSQYVLNWGHSALIRGWTSTPGKAIPFKPWDTRGPVRIKSRTWDHTSTRKKSMEHNKQCHQHVWREALPLHHNRTALPKVQQGFRVEIINLFHHTRQVISQGSEFKLWDQKATEETTTEYIEGSKVTYIPPVSGTPTPGSNPPMRPHRGSFGPATQK